MGIYPYEKTYRQDCKVVPEVKIHENRVNGQIYYIAETDRDLDFEFKGKTLVKMWDAREERTYYPEAIESLRWSNKDFKEVYDSVVSMVSYYIRDPFEQKWQRSYVHKQNLVALNNIRKAENELKKRIPAIKRSCETERPVIHKRDRMCPDFLWVDHPEYITMCPNQYVCEHRTLNDARKWGMRHIEPNRTYPPVKIYKKTGQFYNYVGSVMNGEIGAYVMSYFLNKNGAFQMKWDGSLAGALYRW